MGSSWTLLSCQQTHKGKNLFLHYYWRRKKDDVYNICSWHIDIIANSKWYPSSCKHSENIGILSPSCIRPILQQPWNHYWWQQRRKTIEVIVLYPGDCEFSLNVRQTATWLNSFNTVILENQELRYFVLAEWMDQRLNGIYHAGKKSREILKMLKSKLDHCCLLDASGFSSDM
jgi:hypothetical protein